MRKIGALSTFKENDELTPFLLRVLLLIINEN